MNSVKWAIRLSLLTFSLAAIFSGCGEDNPQLDVDIDPGLIQLSMKVDGAAEVKTYNYGFEEPWKKARLQAKLLIDELQKIIPVSEDFETQSDIDQRAMKKLEEFLPKLEKHLVETHKQVSQYLKGAQTFYGDQEKFFKVHRVVKALWSLRLVILMQTRGLLWKAQVIHAQKAKLTEMAPKFELDTQLSEEADRVARQIVLVYEEYLSYVGGQDVHVGIWLDSDFGDLHNHLNKKLWQRLDTYGVGQQAREYFELKRKEREARTKQEEQRQQWLTELTSNYQQLNEREATLTEREQWEQMSYVSLETLQKNIKYRLREKQEKLNLAQRILQRTNDLGKSYTLAGLRAHDLGHLKKMDKEVERVYLPFQKRQDQVRRLLTEGKTLNEQYSYAGKKYAKPAKSSEGSFWQGRQFYDYQTLMKMDQAKLDALTKAVKDELGRNSQVVGLVGALYKLDRELGYNKIDESIYKESYESVNDQLESLRAEKRKRELSKRKLTMFVHEALSFSSGMDGERRNIHLHQYFFKNFHHLTVKELQDLTQGLANHFGGKISSGDQQLIVGEFYKHYVRYSLKNKKFKEYSPVDHAQVTVVTYRNNDLKARADEWMRYLNTYIQDVKIEDLKSIQDAIKRECDYAVCLEHAYHEFIYSWAKLNVSKLSVDDFIRILNTIANRNNGFDMKMVEIFLEGKRSEFLKMRYRQSLLNTMEHGRGRELYLDAFFQEQNKGAKKLKNSPKKQESDNAVPAPANGEESVSKKLAG